MADEQARGFIEQATQSLQSGQFQQALELIEQAIAIDRNNSEAHILRGIALSQTNQPDLATSAFQQAILISPNAKAYYNLAVHQYQLGQKQPALDAAREAVRVDPSHSGARELAGRIERELGLPQVTTARPDDVLQPESSSGEQSAGPGVAQPYGSPYGTQSADYYRQGYVPQEGPIHSLKFVENMGKTWTTLGWAVVGFGALYFAFSLYMIFGTGMMEQIQQAISNPGYRVQQQSGPLSILSNIMWVAMLIGSTTWMALDLADRRGNWLWLLPYIVCCCLTCSLMPWAVVAVYLLAGRK